MALRCLFSNGLLAKVFNNHIVSSNIHTSAALWRTNDWKLHKKSIPKVDEGTKGETSVVLDSALEK